MGVGGGLGRCQGVGGRRPLEILLLGLGISFVLPRTSLHRVSLYRGSAVPLQHLTLKFLALVTLGVITWQSHI